jgi:hypothetical protein
MARALIIASALGLAAAQPIYEENLPRDHAAIRYPSGPPHELIARLSAPTPDDGLAPLLRLLQGLEINPDSQVLVFSKTSQQHPLISPANPRAIYFNDEIAVGVVRGGDAIELAAFDPRQGVRFYTIAAQRLAEIPATGARASQPVVTERSTCLRCHHGVATMGVPGFFVSSVFPTPSGTPDQEGGIITDHRTAFTERWGGWYVTGQHGELRHLGNAVARNPAEPAALDTTSGQNLMTLEGRFDPKGYLSPTSDIVALMTLDHQAHMTNLLTRLGWEARIAEHGAGSTMPDARREGLDRRIEEVVRYLLFVDEAPLASPVRGVSTFTRTFPARGPRDARGRSLRDFDLERRLFRYPLSYYIYSPAIDALPSSVRDRLYRRLYEVLSGADRSPAFAALSTDDRKAALEILRETKQDLPDYWRR